MDLLIGLFFCVLGTLLLFKGADWFMDGVQDLAPLLTKTLMRPCEIVVGNVFAKYLAEMSLIHDKEFA